MVDLLDRPDDLAAGDDAVGHQGLVPLGLDVGDAVAVQGADGGQQGHGEDVVLGVVVAEPGAEEDHAAGQLGEAAQVEGQHHAAQAVPEEEGAVGAVTGAPGGAWRSIVKSLNCSSPILLFRSKSNHLCGQ